MSPNFSIPLDCSEYNYLFRSFFSSPSHGREAKGISNISVAKVEILNSEKNKNKGHTSSSVDLGPYNEIRKKSHPFMQAKFGKVIYNYY